MREALVWIVVGVFASLGMLHLYWASGGAFGSAEAVPRVGGNAAFTPSPAATIMVACALFAAAAVVAAAGGKFATALPQSLPTGAALVLAAVLAARAVGDFRLVGFFKSNREGRFAELDTLYYSPLCVALAVAIVIIVATQGRPA